MRVYYVLPIELLKTLFFCMIYTEKLCSKFGEDRSTNNATVLSTDAGRTDGRTFTWFYILSNVCALHWTDKKNNRSLKATTGLVGTT